MELIQILFNMLIILHYINIHDTKCITFIHASISVSQQISLQVVY